MTRRFSAEKSLSEDMAFIIGNSIAIEKGSILILEGKNAMVFALVAYVGDGVIHVR